MRPHAPAPKAFDPSLSLRYASRDMVNWVKQFLHSFSKRRSRQASHDRAIPVAYRVLRDCNLEKRATAGTIVYRYLDHDYGLAKNDSRKTGIEHISVTLNPYGREPFFTVPVRDLEYADGSGRIIETEGYANDGPL